MHTPPLGRQIGLEDEAAEAQRLVAAAFANIEV